MVYDIYGRHRSIFDKAHITFPLLKPPSLTKPRSSSRTSLFPSGASAGPNHRGEPTACCGKSTYSVGDKLVLEFKPFN